MASFTFGIGKGLRESAYPYRLAYVFGAELNAVDTNGWTGIPVIVEPTTAFDLSQISIGREVVVALLGVTATSAGTYQVTFRWYRDRDNALLYEYNYSDYSAAGSWYAIYSYIGWVDWEIRENGGYHLDIIVSGPDSYFQKLAFTIVGIAEPLTEPVVEGYFMSGFTNSLLYARDWFVEAFRICSSWIWPFNLLAEPLDWIQYAFFSMASHFSKFGVWVSAVTDRIAGILGAVDILGLLRTWLEYAEWAWAWVSNAAINVSGVVNTWWSSTRLTVLAMIDEASQYLTSLVNTLQVKVSQVESSISELLGRLPALDELVSWWGNWTGNVSSVIDTWWTGMLVQVQGLISSAFIERESWWAGWQDWRDKVAEFFSDPVEYIWSRFTDWFLGPEV